MCLEECSEKYLGEFEKKVPRYEQIFGGQILTNATYLYQRLVLSGKAENIRCEAGIRLISLD